MNVLTQTCSLWQEMFLKGVLTAALASVCAPLAVADDAPAKWRDLPPLTSLNPVTEVKPGATVLLTGINERNRQQVVLAFQRYGRGKALVMPVQDTWMWRMHATMALKDKTHHTFWQRLVRWVVDGVPDRVMASVSPDRVQRGEPVTVTAEVSDPEYKGINDGRITAMDVDVVIDGGAYVTLSPVVLSRGSIHAAGAYRCANTRIRGRAMFTNTPPNGAFRGFGAPQTQFAMEVHMERIAETLGVDPVKLRERNALRAGDLTATGQKLHDDCSALAG